MKKLLQLSLLVIFTTLASCVQFAPPHPLITAGGPGTAKKGGSEVAVAAGTGLALFDGAHAGGNGWFGRWRYGISEKLDIGVDGMGTSHSGGSGSFNFKLASRYEYSSRMRLELGIGATDSSDGKSASLEAGVTVGPQNRNKFWNRYMSARLAFARGFSKDYWGFGKENTDPLPTTYFGLLNWGITGKVSPNQKIFFEVGTGYIDPEGHEPGPLLFWGVGLLYGIHEE